MADYELALAEFLLTGVERKVKSYKYDEVMVR